MDRQLFDSRSAFQAALQTCMGRARLTLQLFDPDFGWWQLGASSTDAQLRAFLRGGGRLLLAAHSNELIERDHARFLRLLDDYRHQIECRLTPRNLRHLTDSFCIADGRDIVRRFHCDHFRGEVCLDDPESTRNSAERFDAIWMETLPGLQSNTTGL
ncbi:DUF7931 domain-containing protein [Massilia endophytica]|uniref:DUF7931 domain-containing protein n=1 Tax=Massilia endophytica TaxID=2899220 RepID=UPI001E409D4E|nr:hypothetical protein [Massilia endophytica]UGQ45121.1 hypothetical protein LSQ66_15110 [Massilia endophytica]